MARGKVSFEIKHLTLNYAPHTGQYVTVYEVGSVPMEAPRSYTLADALERVAWYVETLGIKQKDIKVTIVNN